MAVYEMQAFAKFLDQRGFYLSTWLYISHFSLCQIICKTFSEVLDRKFGYTLEAWYHRT